MAAIVPDFSWYGQPKMGTGLTNMSTGMSRGGLFDPNGGDIFNPMGATQQGNSGIPGIGGNGVATPGNGFGDMKFMDKASLGIGGLQTLANLWMGFQANKLAKDQFKFTKKTTEANMANTISSFNTALEDRIRSRAVVEGRGEGYADQYLEKNMLKNNM